MTVELRMEERFAVEVLRRELNATFTHFDDNSADGMADGLFELPDGTLGALEVTTLAAPRAMQFEALTLGRDWSEVVDGVEWFWAIWVAPGLPLKAMEQHLGVVLRTAEAAGQHHLERAIWLGESASHRWMQDQELILHGYGSDSGKFPGLVQLIPTDHHGAFVQDGLGDDIHTWLDSELATPAVARKIAKLDATRRPERHLFLRVHESAPSDSLLQALCFSDDTPSTDLDPSFGLSGLWVAPRWGSALRWLATHGWSRFDFGA